MAAKPKLSPEQWQAARRSWEHDARAGYAWLVDELHLPVSAPAVRKRALAEAWEKTGAAPAENRPRPRTRAAGRPSAYKPEFAAAARRMCLLGATDADLAAAFEVVESTINRWKVSEFEFREAIKTGKAAADAHVAESLYKSAIGGHYVTEVSESVGDDEEARQKRTQTTKQIPPSVTAQIFWLKNRRPDLWRDAVQAEVELSGPPPEELTRIYEEKMAIARERQRAVLAERGLLRDDD